MSNNHKKKGKGEKTNCEKAIALAKGTPYEFTPDPNQLVAVDGDLSIKERSGSEIAEKRRKIELDCPGCDRVYTGRVRHHELNTIVHKSKP